MFDADKGGIFVSFHFSKTLTATVKLASLQPYDRKYFSVKTASASIFSNHNRKITVFVSRWAQSKIWI